MARDRTAMTNTDLEEFKAAMDEQPTALRTALADDLGGDPDDYRPDERVAVDGGDP